MRRAALGLAVLILVVAGGLALPAARAGGPTYVAGDVSGRWLLEGSPYFVTADVSVPAALSLTIDAGVEVRFAAGAGLLVRGSLFVKGSDAAPVAFTSNGSASAGSWRGIAVEGSAWIASAWVAYAERGLDLEGGSATVDRLAVTSSFTGLRVNRSSPAIARSSFSMNEAAGVVVDTATVSLVRTEISSNPWGLVLAAATVSIDNGTLAGSAVGDADLHASRLTLANTTSSHAFRFHDVESTVTERWFATALVTDRFGTPVPAASVTVEGGGLPTPLLREMDPDGRARWIDLVGRVTSSAGPIVPAYGFTAASKGSTATRSVSLAGETLVPLVLPADVTAPAAEAGPDLVVSEDRAVTFDGRGSADNDPAFPSGAAFTWRLEENGTPLVLPGSIATHTFRTPGLYEVILEVTDAAGNVGEDVLVVTVRDITAPVPGMSIPARVVLGETALLDAGPSQDNDPRFPETGNFTWTVEAGGQSRTLYGRIVTFRGWWGAGEYRVTLAARDAAGNAAEATGAIQVVPGPDFAWVAAALAAWFSALGIWGTERGRIAFMSWFALPLFTRMRKDEVLDQFTRGQVYGYIVVHPGDSYIDIKRNLQLNNGTLTYHLRILERDGLITAKSAGTRKLFYAKGARVPEDGGGMHEVQQQILRHLKESGGLAVNDVAGVIGISRQLAIYHLRDLSRRGLVRIERRAFRIVAYAEGPQGPAPPGPP